MPSARILGTILHWHQPTKTISEGKCTVAIDRIALKGAYARLHGIERALPQQQVANVRAELALDCNNIAHQIGSLTGADVSPFIVPSAAFHGDGRSAWCNLQILRSKLLQLIHYLEHVYQVGAEVIQIGTLFNSIKDADLKSRCADLLSAPGNFDRAINQTTQVLEDRIRRKSEQDNNVTGVQLVNAVLKTDLNTTILKVSADESEQRGFTDICRGIMAAFRNPTHHQITDKFSREDALKVCAFIDNLLRVIDAAEVQRRPT